MHTLATKSPPTGAISPHDAQRLERLRRLVRLMDGAFRIPGTSIAIGLDSIAGLAPVVGDVATALISLYIVRQAREMGVPQATLRRMYANVAIDCVGGFTPIVGDLFDVAFKANARNLKLLEESLRRSGTNSSVA